MYRMVPKGSKKEDTQAYICFSMINRLFKIEKDNSNITYDQLKNIRQEKSLAIVNDFFDKIHELEKMSLPKSHFGEAVRYASNQESKLRTYLKDGRIEISNNVTERAIRNFTIGRGNWMFMNTAKGAEASSYIYSIVETAKLNKLKPYEYINYILSYLAGKDLSDKKDLEAVMPWATLPQELYSIKKS